MRKINEIEEDILNLINESFNITPKEIGEKLKISPRFLNKVLLNLVKSGKIKEMKT